MGASAEMTAQATAQAGTGTSAGMGTGGGMGAAVSGAASSNTLLTTLLIIVAIIAAVMIIENTVQYFLARKDRFYWGLILPAAHLIYGVVRFVMIFLANKGVTSVSSDLLTTIIQTALISLLFLELLVEYTLVRKHKKVLKKLAPSDDSEEAVGV